jgi:glycosyltransferase involved in cell wall biosynthesis
LQSLLPGDGPMVGERPDECTSSAPLANSEKASRKRVDLASKMKQVLVVSFDFPPYRTSGVYRMTGLTRYLPQFGWQPTVLTIRLAEGDQDPKLLEKLPEVRVVRTRYLRVSGWENPSASVVRGLGGLRPSPAATRQPRFDRYLRSLGELGRSTLYFPDHTVGWIPFALAKAIQLHRDQPFDVVYTTNPPRSAPVIGSLFKALSGVPWVLEFMDPWYSPDRPLRRRFENWLQVLMFRQANRVVVMTNGHAEELRHSYHVPDNRLAVVRNGFDEDDFNSNSPTETDLLAPGYLHLSHFGTIYPHHSGNFFPALAELVREHPDLKKRLRVNIIGYPDEEAQRYASGGELKDIIRIHGYMEHHHALQAMHSSHCLLLFLGHRDFSRLAVSSKTYEYLRVGRPILALTYEGEVKELVEEGKAGWVVQPNNTEAIKEVLRMLLSGSRDDGPPRPARPEFVAQFRYDRLAAQLASIFDEVASDDC